MPTSHRQTRNRKQAGYTHGQGQKAGGFTGAETRGDGQRQVGSIPGKQSEKKCWRVRHESEDKQRLSGVRLHIYWLDWRW